MSLGYLDDTGPPNAVIYGCSGAVLTGEERRFFTEVRPTGFILFERNCLNPGQVLRLVAELKEITGRAGTPVLIDQEGGRVQRLKPPNWPARPAAASFQALARHDPALAGEAVRLNAELIATELLDIGITVDCAPINARTASLSFPAFSRACARAVVTEESSASRIPMLI